jgi:hypothetical protein
MAPNGRQITARTSRQSTVGAQRVAQASEQKAATPKGFQPRKTTRKKGKNT